MINISGYRIDDVIYDGLKTLIYKGYKESNSQYFVIKTLKSEYNSSKNRLKLKHEYEISKDLNIKGIIKAQDILTHNNNVYLVLDNFEGISLKKLLESQSIPIDLCLEIMIALLSSVAELHYYKLIHKDLKPSNILLNLSDKQVKITDFGISSLFLKENKDMVSPNLLEGSLPYLSPEQTGRINRQIDFRSDIYSLGITFYELLTRQKPFQGKDPLEWIFCHISKTPVSPNEINSEIPITLSNIIMKCLKKLPEERYQSVFCLKTDLEECLKQLNTKNSIDPFHIAVNDIPQHLHISQKLYGRTKEKDLLINALNRIHNGKPELVLISGYSGTGKTSIVKEIYKSITEKNAYYTNGKYDQYNRNPYGAIIQAFRKLINQILINDENKLTYWKNVILEALNPNTQLLIDFIPELIYIVGSQPELPLVEPKEAESRFIFTIIKFIKIFAKKENTLVIFLDDLQWIDLPSLKLIESVLLDKEEKYFLLMGAYRDNEVNDTHPLKNIIQELIKSQIIIQSIYLNPLTMDESNELISDTFYSSKENTISIAELVYRKTKGNPFFINQFLELLYEDGHILFDSVKGSWTWTIPKITSRELTDDIAIFMKQRIDQLPEKCKYILQIASLFGNRFEISILSEILEQSVMESVTDIELAIQESFIIGLQDEINYDNISRDGDDKELTSYNAYKFSHDQIQQVFYTSIPEEKRKEIHLMLGLKLLKMYEDCESDYYLFNTVNNLNIVAKYISHSDVPLLKLAKLNLMAGKKAKEFIAFDSALNYFSMGISFLAEHSWDTDYDLTLEIYLEKAESEFLNIHYEKAEQLYDYILTKAKSPLDKANIYALKTYFYRKIDKSEETVKSLITGLKILDININQKPCVALIIEFIKFKYYMRKISTEDILKLPELKDKKLLTVLKLLYGSINSVYDESKEIFIYVVMKILNLTIKHGMNNYFPSALLLYTGIKIVFFMDKKEKLLFELALTLSEKWYESKSYNYFCSILSYQLIMPFKHSSEECVKAFDMAIAEGELVNGIDGWSIYLLAIQYKGDSLDFLYSKASQHIDLAEKIHTNAPLWFKGYQLYVQSLKELTKDPINFIDEEVNILYFNNISLEKHIKTYNGFFHLLKLELYYLFGKFDRVIETIDQIKPYFHTINGFITITLYYYYTSLAIMDIYPSASKIQKLKYLKLIKKHTKKINKYVKLSSGNFLHKYLIIKARLAQLKGQTQKAIILYNQAIEDTKKNDIIKDCAIANELITDLYLSIGLKTYARFHILESIYGYEKWGALSKVKQLKDKYAELLTKLSNEKISANMELDNTVSFTTKSEQEKIDLMTIIKSSQAISEEIYLAKLIEKLMYIVIENVGAQKGFFIKVNNDNEPSKKRSILTAEIEAFIDKEQTISYKPIPIEECPNLSHNIVFYVLNSQKDLLLNDASTDIQFSSDPYIQNSNIKSVMCIPIQYQGKLSAIIYLENNNMVGTFNESSLKMLKMLSSQIAISFENATLYKNLLNSEELYRTLVESSNDAIVIIQDNMIQFANQKAYIMSGYSEDDFNKINIINIISPMDKSLAIERIKRLMEGEKLITPFELRLIQKNGTEIWVETSSVGIEWQGKPAIFTFLRDINRRKQAEFEVAKLNEKKAILEKEISRLITNIHNSLKNKLESAYNFITHFISQHASLSNEMKDITTASKLISHCSIESKNILFILTHKECNLYTFMDELELRIQLALRYYKISYSISKKISTQNIILDSKTVQYLLDIYDELLNNIIKHSKAINVDFNVYDKDNQLYFTIQDNGIGFDYLTTINRKGTYGLSIIEDLAKEINGNLTILSQPAIGTNVKLIINC